MVTKKEINVTLLAPLTRNNRIKAKSRQDTTVISRISTPFTYSSVMAILRKISEHIAMNCLKLVISKIPESKSFVNRSKLTARR